MSIHFLILLLFFTFPLFLFSFALRIFFFCPSLPFLPVYIVWAGGRRRPNLGLFCCVRFVLSVLLSQDLFWCFVVFGLV